MRCGTRDRPNARPSGREDERPGPRGARTPSRRVPCRSLSAGSGVRSIQIAPSRTSFRALSLGNPGWFFPCWPRCDEKGGREAPRVDATVPSRRVAFFVMFVEHTRAVLASFITLTTPSFSLSPQINDISLEDYIGVKSKHAVYVPHTAGRYAQKRFRKAQCPITERLVNALMMHGRNNGKKLMAVRIVKHAMDIIHLLSDQNPIQVIVDAIINAGPREDATRVGSAGVIRRQAVDISPLRRVNQAIYLITTGAREAAFRNVKTIAECLADELINAAKGSSNSYAIKKKDELERVAKANR